MINVIFWGIILFRISIILAIAIYSKSYYRFLIFILIFLAAEFLITVISIQGLPPLYKILRNIPFPIVVGTFFYLIKKLFRKQNKQKIISHDELFDSDGHFSKEACDLYKKTNENIKVADSLKSKFYQKNQYQKRSLIETIKVLWHAIVGTDVGSILVTVYLLGDGITFIYLTFLDGYVYNWWNWIIAIPINLFLAQLWPLYWGIIRWLPSIF